MIVELFGPSGAGKTTLSRALASVLRRRGYPVALVSSARPSEQFEPGSGSDLAFMRVRAHLNRAAKALGAVAALFSCSDETPVEAGLMSMLMTQPLLTRVRNRRYLVSMRKLWADARSSERVTIFDQGYLSALCSILCRNSAPDGFLPGLLDLLPRPDVLVCVHVPEAVIEARLRSRLGELGYLARRLELDIFSTLRQVRIAADLRNEIARRGEVALIDCGGSGVPLPVAQTVVDQIETRPSARNGLFGKEIGNGPRSADYPDLHTLLFVK